MIDDDFLLERIHRLPRPTHQQTAVQVTPAGEKLDKFLSAAIAEFKGEPAASKLSEGVMREKLAELRKFRAEQRKILDQKIDAAKAKALEVYPRAHAAAERELAEVEDIDEELDLLDDEVNQGMGGNNPPKGGSES